MARSRFWFQTFFSAMNSANLFSFSKAEMLQQPSSIARIGVSRAEFESLWNLWDCERMHHFRRGRQLVEAVRQHRDQQPNNACATRADDTGLREQLLDLGR
jgi:hypothetical protein